MVTAELVRELFSYDPQEGLLRWRKSPSVYHRYIVPGTIAGTKTTQGYWQIAINNRRYRAQRVVWLYMTGEWPLLQVDHKNADRLDNKWDNLRLATVAQNQMNTRKRLRNKSGYKGAVPFSYGGFGAYIKKDGRSRYLGTFTTVEAAHQAYCEAATRLFGEHARFE